MGDHIEQKFEKVILRDDEFNGLIGNFDNIGSVRNNSGGTGINIGFNSNVIGGTYFNYIF